MREEKERQRKKGRGRERGIAHGRTRHNDLEWTTGTQEERESKRERVRTKACFKKKERERERERDRENSHANSPAENCATKNRFEPVKRNLNRERDCICTGEPENNIDKTVFFEGMEGGGASGDSTFGKSVYDHKRHALKGNSQTFSWTRHELNVNTHLQC